MIARKYPKETARQRYPGKSGGFIKESIGRPEKTDQNLEFSKIKTGYKVMSGRNLLLTFFCHYRVSKHGAIRPHCMLL
jgi:hypothetical protein